MGTTTQKTTTKRAARTAAATAAKRKLEAEIDADLRANLPSFDPTGDLSERLFQRRLIERLKPMGALGPAIAKLLGAAEHETFADLLAVAASATARPAVVSGPSFDELVAGAAALLALARESRDADEVTLHVYDPEGCVDQEGAPFVEIHWGERDRSGRLVNGAVSLGKPS